MLKLSLIFGFKNRDGSRVRRCLDSLAEQEFDQFEVIFVDYGSEPECRKEIEPIVKSYGFTRYVYCETRGRPWNRAHALNIGIRLARSELVMTADIDLLFSEFSLKRMIDGYDGKVALHAGCYLLPEGFDNWNELSSHKSRYGKPCKEALGILLLPKCVFEEVGGFDEFYQFWGAEDEDLGSRLDMIGYERQFLNIDDYPLYHQWHPVQNYVTHSFMPLGYWTRMQFHFGQYAHVVQRNVPEGMGHLLEKHERPALSFLDGERQPHIKLFSHNGLARELAASFMSLAPGEAVEINSDWARPAPFAEKIINGLNRVFFRFNMRLHIEGNRNNAKEFFWSFILQYPEAIKDFAYTGDERRFYLIRSEQD